MKRNLILHLDNLRESHESIDKLLSQNFLDDVLVVIVSKSSWQLVVIHVVFILPEAPKSGHFFCINQLEFAVIISPGYDVFVLMIQK